MATRTVSMSRANRRLNDKVYSLLPPTPRLLLLLLLLLLR